MILCYFFIWFMLYSFLGWLYESVLYTLITGYPTNSGFLYGPFCPIYGFGSIIGIILFYNRIDSVIAIFLISFFIEGLFEFLIGTILENIFHKKWWDYSELNFNIKGRVSLLSSLVFGLLVVLLVKFIHPFVEFVSMLIPQGFVKLITVFMVYFLMRDIIFTVAGLTECSNNFNKYQLFCCKLKKRDEKIKNIIYKVLSTSKLLSSIMERSKSITEKFSINTEVSRDYVKINSTSLEQLKDRILSKIQNK